MKFKEIKNSGNQFRKRRNKFVEFIKDENQSEIAMNGYIVLKRKYKNNQLLYCKYEYKNKLEGLSEQFEYKGFYNLVTNQFYGQFTAASFAA